MAKFNDGDNVRLDRGVGPLPSDEVVKILNGPFTHSGVRNCYTVTGNYGVCEVVHESRMRPAMKKTTLAQHMEKKGHGNGVALMVRLRDEFPDLYYLDTESEVGKQCVELCDKVSWVCGQFEESFGDESPQTWNAEQSWEMWWKAGELMLLWLRG